MAPWKEEAPPPRRLSARLGQLFALVLVTLLAAAAATTTAYASSVSSASFTGGTGTVSVGGTEATAFGGSYTVDALTTFLDILFISIIALTIVFAPDYLLPRSLPIAEFAVVLPLIVRTLPSMAIRTA